ncbi:MAG: hypothetical protein JRN68_06625 [Nitrososphaerota archaeon]|nr:hypothetical protein [Nitrososphaerota archaeon]
MDTTSEGKEMLIDALGRLTWVTQVLKDARKIISDTKEREVWLSALESRKRTLELLVVELSTLYGEPTLSDFIVGPLDVVQGGR